MEYKEYIDSILENNIYASDNSKIFICECHTHAIMVVETDQDNCLEGEDIAASLSFWSYSYRDPICAGIIETIIYAFSEVCHYEKELGIKFIWDNIKRFGVFGKMKTLR